MNHSSEKGNWACITGASGGLGAEYARQLAPDFDLILAARDDVRMKALAAEIGTARKIRIEKIDLTRDEDIVKLEKILTSTKNLDLLVNNAGLGGFGNFVEMDGKTQHDQVLLNVNALFRLSHVALKMMKAQNSGGLINVASVAAFQPIPYAATYSATKAFVKVFSEAIAEELRDTNVHIQCCCPGMTRTEFQSRANIHVSIPDFLWMESTDVVKESLEAYFARKSTVVVTGLVNKTAMALSSSVPSSLNARITGEILRKTIGAK